MVSRYQKRLSGPLLDRTPALRAGASVDTPGDVEVPRVDFEKLSDARRGETSRVIRDRVEAARERQRRRFAGYVDGHSQLLTNADTPALRAGASVGPGEIREFCPVDEAGHSLLRAATPAPRLRLGAGAGVRQLHMSARARLRRPHP